jgi:hypothetical protein
MANRNMGISKQHFREHGQSYCCIKKPARPLESDAKTFNNPLDWWYFKAQQCSFLAALAIRLLPIPATSASSERSSL